MSFAILYINILLKKQQVKEYAMFYIPDAVLEILSKNSLRFSSDIFSTGVNPVNLTGEIPQGFKV